MKTSPTLIHVATIRSLIHNKVKGARILTEEGFYELEVHVDFSEAKGDPVGYCNHQVAKHLAIATKSTDVPMYENCWYIQFTPWAVKELHMPISFRI